MVYHYTLKQQQFALERLIANRGAVAPTAREVNISETTLYRWRKWGESGKIPGFSLSSFSPNPPSHPPDSPLFPLRSKEELPADDLETLVNLKARMIELVDYIMAADKIKRAVDEAPLNQRIAALVQLTDRIIKLAAQLPEPEQECVFRLAGEPEDMHEENDGDSDYTTELASESGGSL
jgi:transposase-like protein